MTLTTNHESSLVAFIIKKKNNYNKTRSRCLSKRGLLRILSFSLLKELHEVRLSILEDAAEESHRKTSFARERTGKTITKINNVRSINRFTDSRNNLHILRTVWLTFHLPQTKLVLSSRNHVRNN